MSWYEDYEPAPWVTEEEYLEDEAARGLAEDEAVEASRRWSGAGLALAQELEREIERATTIGPGVILVAEAPSLELALEALRALPRWHRIYPDFEVNDGSVEVWDSGSPIRWRLRVEVTGC